MSRKAKYKLALQVVGRVIQEWDPYSLLESGCPIDEFDAEVASIVSHIPRIHSAEDATYALSRVFSSAFEPDKFKPNDCREPGSKLFQALTSHGLLPDGFEDR